MSVVLDRPRIIAEPSSVRGAGEVLTEAALEFLAELHERFDSRRLELLEAREQRQDRFDAGQLPDFPEDTRELREADWQIGSIPSDLLDRRVEITGPTNAKMLINALNCGANIPRRRFNGIDRLQRFRRSSHSSNYDKAPADHKHTTRRVTGIAQSRAEPRGHSSLHSLS